MTPIERPEEKLQEAEKLLAKIAEQPLFEELTDEELEEANFSDLSDYCIEAARSFFKKGEDGK